MQKTSAMAYKGEFGECFSVTSHELTCLLAANDRGNTRFAIERISAINKVAFLDKFVPVVVSSNMDVRACMT
jgi:hypothetical protein